MKTCPYCKEPVPEGSNTCPACAEPLAKSISPVPPASPLPPRKWKFLLQSFGLLVALAIGTVAIVILKENRFGPFATGTKNAAFLGTTFGMSPQEASRALQKEGARLVNYDVYRRLDGTHETNLFDYLYPSKEEESIHSDLFMPSIELFDSATEARFVFRKERLESVEIFFKCYTVTNALGLVESVKSNLLGVYRFSKKEDSQYVPGAYNLTYATGESSANMWVNLTDSNKLMINLFLMDSRSQEEQKKQLREREKNAFGPSQ